LAIGVFRSIDRLGHRLVVVLKGFPCSWGKCVFCPFYLEQSSNLREVLETDAEIVERARQALREWGCDRVTVFNGGSFFELPLAVINALRAITRGRVVDIETRPEFLTLENALHALRLLEARELVVRVGLEVVNEEIRNRVLNKGIPQSEVMRLAELRKRIDELGLPIKIVAYVLFGIEGVPEEEVIRSVEEFNRLFHGVIAIRYRRYLPHHPRESSVSIELAQYLERNTMLVDWGEGEEWSIGEGSSSPEAS